MKPFFIILFYSLWHLLCRNTIHLSNILKLEITIFVHREVNSINMLNKLTYRTEEIVIPLGFLSCLLFFKILCFLVIHTFYI